MRANRAVYPVATMCRLLGVSTSGYYAWHGRAPSAHATRDAALLERIREIHRTSRQTSGAPRIHAELIAEGHVVSRKRIARLMRNAGLAGISRRKGTRTTVRDARARAAADLVERNFTAEAPDRLWVADITYIPTWAGFLYLAVVLDVFSRRVIGWSMANHLRTRLVLDALDMALWQRRPDSVIHHSDQGSQYTSIAFGKRCRDAGVRPSTGSVGDCYDNAMCESFFATLECELIDRRRFRSHAEARIAVFEFIEGWYNPRRRHSAIGYLSPINYERSRLPLTCHRTFIQFEPESFCLIRLLARVEQATAARSPSVAQRCGRLRGAVSWRRPPGCGIRVPNAGARCCSPRPSRRSGRGRDRGRGTGFRSGARRACAR